MRRDRPAAARSGNSTTILTGPPNTAADPAMQPPTPGLQNGTQQLLGIPPTSAAFQVASGDACIVARLQQGLVDQWTACSRAADLTCAPCSVVQHLQAVDSSSRPVDLSMALFNVCVIVAVLFLASLCHLAPHPQASKGAGGGTQGLPLSALEFPRLLAALHILENHFYVASGLLRAMSLPVPIPMFAEWGFTWVPFLFMLSGFLRAHRHADDAVWVALEHGSKVFDQGPAEQLTLRQVLSRRSSELYHLCCGVVRLVGRLITEQRWLYRAYPVYLMALLLQVLLGNAAAMPSREEALRWLISEICLVQTWTPGGRGSELLNPPAWFLSTLFALSLSFGFWRAPLWRYRSPVSLLLVCSLCVIFSSIPQIAQFAVGVNIYNNTDLGSLFFRTQATRNPISFWPTYVAGIALARLYHMLAQEEHASGASCAKLLQFMQRWGATAAAILLTLVFCSLTPWESYVWYYSGLLIPLHALFILGLACGEDPLAKFLTRPPLVRLGAIAMPLYLLHYPFVLSMGAWLYLLPEALRAAAPALGLAQLLLLSGAACFLTEAIVKPFSSSPVGDGGL